MDALEVCISRIISRLNQRLESCLHQRTYTAAENSLLTKEVCLGLCTECSLQDTCSRSADGKSVCQRLVKRFACVVLMYSHQTRRSFACLILASYSMARSLRSDHRNVYILRRYDLSEMDIESVSEHQHVALFQVRLDVILI